MSGPRAGLPGATRTCPHCRETILDSATVCPSCKHHLRYGAPPAAGDAQGAEAITPLRVEGSFRNAESSAWEYSMVLTIRNERGEEIARRLVGVGAIHPDEMRAFTLSVEMTPTAGRNRTRH
ncbi:MAG: hypothetical protein J0I77_19290 [Rudaea sp.]|uniref:hypothetical protein n=1 Tax=unclassified Rudaea TaxID=2627037 RepID=UPI0010F9700F|nr:MULTISPECIES: hypothetical protein [unclassified Rudaea]MBN8887878.1 hypothetical protein [Rudaea sp.]MBR0346533.1 hypothetical protein [Rudaea sp.]